MSTKPSMSTGCSKYFLIVPSRMSRAMLEARPGMLEKALLTMVSR